ncbi:MAG: PAS domain-containing sensor histidine kinase [Actinobacteria bacterium]|nr:PAS domain-containing sensor histidine kinase [Actinomycetota bacterium]MBU2111137.1 PAS domain-containing sensor histidine kinase [Actinomycetota bacterium]
MEGDQAWRPGLDQETLERADWTSQVKDYAIVRLDRDGLVLSWNAGAELVKGYSREEILGRSFEVFYPPEDRESGLPRRLLAVAEADGRAEHQGWRLRRDGVRFWGDVVITAVRGDSGQLLGFVKVTRDLTEQHLLERSRQQFVAGVTHDFRSPLTSIEGYAAMLVAELTDPVLGDFASRVRSNALRLMKLVDLMVEHCQLPIGSVRLNPEQVALGAVLRTVVDDLSTTVQDHEVTIQDTDVELRADLTALARVFTNLIGNAAKYSPPGSRIDVLVERSEDAVDAVDIVVADRGRGIDPEDRDTIFDEFVRGRRAHDDGGFGLGLSVVRALVEQHGGAVRIDDGRFGGTDVTVRLPLADTGSTASTANGPGLQTAQGS